MRGAGALGEVHHVEHWARDGGRTDTDEGILLCSHHHATVHRRGVDITRVRDTHGLARRVFTDRHGDPTRTHLAG